MSLFHYYNGERISPHSNRLRPNNRLIVIDEGGDLGTDSLFYIMVSAVIDNSKMFEKITKVFPSGNKENKHYKSLDETKIKILTEVRDCNAGVYVVSYRKSKLKIETSKRKKEHNLGHMLELIELVLKSDDGRIYDIIIDNTSLMNGHEDIFVRMCNQIAGLCGKTIENIEMRDSSGTKVLQIHDYITGTVAGHIENENDAGNDYHERFRIIESKIREIIRK